MNRTSIISAVIMLSVLSAPVAARAQSELAVNHFKAGKSYYDQGRYADALREFKEAHRLSGKPALLYNMGQTCERMGNHERAITYYQDYLDKTGNKDTAVQQKVRNLKQQLATTGIEITCPVVGATVSVDGKDVGQTPLSGPVMVKAGSHQVKVAKAGHAPFSAFVSVTVGSVVKVTAELASTETGQTDRGAASTDGAASGAKQPAAEPQGRKRFWTWIAFAGAGVALAAGTALGLVALKKANDAPADTGPQADDARKLARGADALFVIGAAAAIGGAILLYFEGRPTERPQAATTAITPAVGPGFAGVQAHWRF